MCGQTCLRTLKGLETAPATALTMVKRRSGPSVYIERTTDGASLTIRPHPANGWIMDIPK